MNETERLVDGLLSAYNAHLTEDAAALYTESGRHREIALGGEKVGRDEIAQGLAGLLAAFPDARWIEQNRIADDDAAAVAYRLEGTLAAPFGPYAPAGQRLELEGVLLIEVDAAAITRTTDYWDASTFHRQMTPAQA